MPTLSPETNQVTVGGFRFTSFADTSTYTLEGEDGFSAKTGVGGTVGFVRVPNPLASLKIDLMQGSLDIPVMEGLVQICNNTNLPIPVLIVDILRPGQTIAGTAYPKKRADDPGVAQEIATISYEFHVKVNVRAQSASLINL